MSRIIISNDGECILMRQGSTVIVIGQEQAESIAATESRIILDTCEDTR